MSSVDLSPKKLDRRDLFDLLIRFSLGLTFAFGGGVCIRSAIDGFQAHEMVKALSALAIGSYTMMIAYLYMVRLPPISRASGAWPCIAAILGGFLMSALVFLKPCETLPLWAQLTACAMIIIGNGFAVLILLQLGKSFSILPESRKLVTHGPYAIVRHPLYLVEAVATLGVVINFLSVWALLLVAVQLALQIVRIRYEEKTLKETFPEYEAYAKKTWRLIPGIY